MTWQPISTAPKDGARVILRIEGEAIEGWYEDGLRDDGTRWKVGYWDVVSLPSHGCGCCSEANPEPTGWMPLPPPPEQGQ